MLKIIQQKILNYPAPGQNNLPGFHLFIYVFTWQEKTQNTSLMVLIYICIKIFQFQTFHLHIPTSCLIVKDSDWVSGKVSLLEDTWRRVNYIHTYTSICTLRSCKLHMITLRCLIWCSQPTENTRKFGKGESLENLVNHPWFTKLKPSKFLLTFIIFWVNLFTRQTFFAKCSKRVKSPNFFPAKLSHYMVYYLCPHSMSRTIMIHQSTTA